MKLIKLETKGFKSFADKTTLKFDGGIVGVVGPNGSGKSNINDAIKWVLGESSVKTLRGDNMEDVIFAGSKTVKALDKATVSLTFDNSSHSVSIPHEVFTLTREIERGLGSKYFINGEKARLKDIKEIAMESGIGKSSLAIISQGTVAEISQATPEQRRAIFEEAAGISKYKKRKLEALRKLEKTSEALEKIKSVVRELERQLIPLKKQAEKAKIYLVKRSDLKGVEIGLIVEDLEFYSEKLKELSKDLETFTATKDDLNSRIDVIDRNIETKTSHKLELENEIIMLSSKFQDVSDKLRNLEFEDSQDSQRRKMIIAGKVTSSDAAKKDAMKEELEGMASKISQYTIWEEKSILDVNQRKADISEVQRNISSNNAEINSYKANILKIKTRILILKQHQEKKTNLFSGTRAIVENQNIFPGVKGIVADLFDVASEFKVAIESILSNALQNVVVSHSEDAVKCVNFLKANKAGRATFIPLSSIQPKGIRQEHLDIISNIDGFVAMAYELVSTSPEFEILKKFMLGNIVIARDIDSANRISKTLDKRYMIVSLEGDVIRIGGVISGGEKARTRSLLGVEDQITQLESSAPPLQEQMLELEKITAALSNGISEDHAFIAELNIETAKVVQKKSIIKSQFNTLKSDFEAMTDEKLELKDELKSMDSVQTLELEKSSIQAMLKAKRGVIMEFNNELSGITISKTELEKSLRQLIEDSSDKTSSKNQAEYIIDTGKNRLIEEYELTLEAATGNYSLNMEREAAREIVSNLRAEIKELGHINVDSIEAYDEIDARYTKLFDSQEELASAQQIILSAIDEMDKIIVTKLDKTVTDVNKEMNTIFRTMFGGGFAEVRYSDESNLLETGIEVIAQPPGKTVKNLKLFSGGEKALVAISLLFAILKSKPLPLCILDEVEAALDDANVIRFADYLRELKDKTQFIVVTHRVGTMARVDHLFGATMQQRGVTSMFTVNLKTAKEMID